MRSIYKIEAMRRVTDARGSWQFECHWHRAIHHHRHKLIFILIRTLLIDVCVCVCMSVSRCACVYSILFLKMAGSLIANNYRT